MHSGYRHCANMCVAYGVPSQRGACVQHDATKLHDTGQRGSHTLLSGARAVCCLASDMRCKQSMLVRINSHSSLPTPLSSIAEYWSLGALHSTIKALCTYTHSRFASSSCTCAYLQLDGAVVPSERAWTLLDPLLSVLSRDTPLLLPLRSKHLQLSV